MIDSAPAHVGDVQQTVDASEVHEGPEVGDVGDGALDRLVLADGIEQLVLRLGTLSFDELSTADDDVATFLVDLEDLGPDHLADEDADVAGTSDIHLRGGEEDRDTDVDEQAALDLAGGPALDDVAFIVGIENALPTTNAVGLALGEFDDAGFVFEIFEEDLDHVTDAEFVEVVELALVDESFGLQTHIDDGIVAGLADDLAIENLASAVLLDFRGQEGLHVGFGYAGGGDLRFVESDIGNEIVINHDGSMRLDGRKGARRGAQG